MTTMMTAPACPSCGQRGRLCNARTCRVAAKAISYASRPAPAVYAATKGPGGTLIVDGADGGANKEAVDGREGRSGRDMIDKATADWLEAVRKSGARPDQVKAIEAEINETMGRHFAALEQEDEEDDHECGPAEMPAKSAKPLAASAPTRPAWTASMTARTSRPTLATWSAPRAKAPPKPAHPVPEVAAFASVGPEWLAEAARLHGLYMASPPWVRSTPFGSYLATQIAPAMRKRIETLEAEVAEARAGGAHVDGPEVAAYAACGAETHAKARRMAYLYSESRAARRSGPLAAYIAAQIGEPTPRRS